jgi:nucleoporin NUP42
VFGAPSSNNVNSGASGFSAFANKSNSFAQIPSTTGVFGQPSQSNQPSPFIQTQASAMNPFGAQNPLSNPVVAQSNLFEAPSPRQNPFAQTQPTTKSSGLNPFALNAQAVAQPSGGNADLFDADLAPVQQNGFAAPWQNGVSNGKEVQRNVANGELDAVENAPARPMAGTTSAAVSFQIDDLPDISKLSIHPPIESYSSRDANGILTMFKGKRVVYDKDNKPSTKGSDGVMRPIQYPNGPPDPVQGTAKPIEEYDERTLDYYAYFRKYGHFKDGMMPLMPPMREWCQWDF